MNKKYVLEFSKAFKKALLKLDKDIHKQIEAAVKKLKFNYNTCDVKKLSGVKDLYRLRSGDYRIIFEKLNDKLVIVLLDVKHRKEIYRDL